MKYKDSGVDIDRAKRAKDSITEHMKATWGKNVLSETGAFGGLFSVPKDYTDPVLVSSIDGVGTKLFVAKMARRFDSIGQDLVNHCVNDILVQGARPLFFLDYVATGSLEPDVIHDIVGGIAAACKENGCALIGGETAEMPGLYKGDDFDLAGCVVGVVDKEKIIDGSSINKGDVVFGLPSSGLHTNGYSLARHILFDKGGLGVEDRIEELGTVADELLAVHRSYLPVMSQLMEKVAVKGMAHITGGGILDNLPRILPRGVGATIRKDAWTVPGLFTYLQKAGDVAEDEMFRVFNMGMGMLFVVDKADAAAVTGHATLIGEIVTGEREVRLV